MDWNTPLLFSLEILFEHRERSFWAKTLKAREREYLRCWFGWEFVGDGVSDVILWENEDRREGI